MEDPKVMAGLFLAAMFVYKIVDKGLNSLLSKGSTAKPLSAERAEWMMNELRDLMKTNRTDIKDIHRILNELLLIENKQNDQMDRVLDSIEDK